MTDIVNDILEGVKAVVDSRFNKAMARIDALEARLNANPPLSDVDARATLAEIRASVAELQERGHRTQARIEKLDERTKALTRERTT